MLILITILAGLMLLFIGGHYLVQHAVLLAEKLGLSPLVISMTIVAFGTSAPELVVSIDALLNDYDDLVLGNIIGSNIANMMLVLPVAAIIFLLTVSKTIVRREGGVMIGATVLFAGLCLMGQLSILAGVVLLSVLLAFILFSMFHSDQSPGQIDDHVKPSSSGIKDGMMIILSLLALALGSRLFVEGAVDLSRLLGVSEAVIGLTVVAVGTAAPELITVAIGGVAAMVAPISVDDHFITVDLPLLVVISMALVVLALILPRIGRRSGFVLLAGYAAYTAILF